MIRRNKICSAMLLAALALHCAPVHATPITISDATGKEVDVSAAHPLPTTGGGGGGGGAVTAAAGSYSAGFSTDFGTLTDAATTGNGSLIAIAKQLRVLLGLSSATGAAVPANAGYVGGIGGDGFLHGLLTSNAGRLSVDVNSGGGSNASVGATGSAVPASGTYAGGVGVDGFLHGIRMANDGTVRFDPTGTTTQPVSGTFWQSTQPVSGTFWQTTQPVSGTITANAGTGTFAVSQKAATSTSATLQSAVSATGNGSTISTDGMGSVIYTVTGAYVGTVTFEGTEDGTNYSALTAIQLGTSTLGSSTTGTGLFEVSTGGLQNVRARVTWTSGTSVTVTAHAVPIAYAAKSLQVTPINAKTVTNAAIDITTATIGDNTIVAGVAGKTIKVIACYLIVGGATTLKWKDGAAGTVLVGQQPFVANQGLSLPISPLQGVYHFQTTTTGNALMLNSTAAVSIGGSIVYVQE